MPGLAWLTASYSSPNGRLAQYGACNLFDSG